MIPNPWMILGAILVAVSVYFYGHHKGWVERDFEMQAEIGKKNEESRAKEQEMINESKAKEAAQVNEKVKNDYENKLAIIKHTYGGMRLPGSNQASEVPGTSSSLDGTPADPKFIEKCAVTTQMLVSLQAWLNEQIGIFNAK